MSKREPATVVSRIGNVIGLIACVSYLGYALQQYANNIQPSVGLWLVIIVWMSVASLGAILRLARNEQ